MATFLHTDTISIAAGKSAERALKGDFLLIAESNAPEVSVAFGRPESFSRMVEGMLYRPRDGQSFDRVFFKNESASNMVIKVAWGLGDIDLKLQPDRALATTLRGDAYVGGAINAAVAAEYSYVQLLNPVGSGVSVIVTRIDISFDIRSPVSLLQYAVAMANLNQTTRKSDGAQDVAKALLRQESNAALVGANPFDSLELLAGTPRPPGAYDKYPYVLREGNGIITRPGNVNLRNSTTFHWFEQVG